MADIRETESQLETQAADQSVGGYTLQYLRDFIASSLSCASGITATGTSYVGAAALTAAINVINTVAAGSGVTVQAGMRSEVKNRGANALAVYPPVGGQLEALGTNVAYLLQPGQDAVLAFDPANPNQGYVSAHINVLALSTTQPPATPTGVVWNDGGVISTT